jgi:hypothetical protein
MKRMIVDTANLLFRVAAAIMSAKFKEDTSMKRSLPVKVLYEKRVSIPASTHIDDFEVVTDGESVTVIPLTKQTSASYTIHTLAEVYPSLDEAKPFVVRDGLVLRAVGFQERNLDGEWDGYWQQLTLSKQALFVIEQAEQELKAPQ